MNVKDRRAWLVVALAVAAAGGYALADRDERPTGRQAEIAAKGGQVMPFDLERTTHRFTKTATGVSVACCVGSSAKCAALSRAAQSE